MMAADRDSRADQQSRNNGINRFCRTGGYSNCERKREREREIEREGGLTA